MKLYLQDGEEVMTDVDAETIYVMCRAVQKGFAHCTIQVEYRFGKIMLDVTCVDVDKTFQGFIIDSFRDTEPGT